MASKAVHRIWLGRISATIWERQSNSGDTYRYVSLQRYRDVNGESEYSDLFFRDDLLVVGKAVDKAFDWITENPIERPDEPRGNVATENPVEHPDNPQGNSTDEAA